MDVMEIASLSMALSQRNVMEQVNVSLMKKSMDMQTQNLTDIVEMMDSVPAPIEVGSFIDIKL